MTDAHGPRVAVLGYGSELRGDDAVGPQVARAVASWEWPDLSAVALQQLAPEQAATLAAADYAFFVDAWLGGAGAEPRLVMLGPGPGPLAPGHASDPGGLLALAEALYGRRPVAWQLLIPAASFGIGAPLSAGACQGALIALRLLRDLIPTLGRGAAAPA